ncbi:C-terminal binding protein AN [Camellia lanceoleosa]|uniref:C-terminal binding protein AN n=1 Tax=Camellia lanceoleosa TaxID=1840588 RepID=A0ACC0ICV5_9ERIC|nr:C-terminal binding protein AN [Camellia lanceoleosa]
MNITFWINRRMEFVFASHSLDVWKSWSFEGSLEECRLVNCRNPLLYMDHVEILAAVGEDDGIAIKLCEHLIVKQSIKCVPTYLSPSPPRFVIFQERM